VLCLLVAALATLVATSRQAGGARYLSAKVGTPTVTADGAALTSGPDVGDAGPCPPPRTTTTRPRTTTTARHTTTTAPPGTTTSRPTTTTVPTTTTTTTARKMVKPTAMR